MLAKKVNNELCVHWCFRKQLDPCLGMLSFGIPREIGGYGATAARLTPDQKVGSSNLSALICRVWGDPFSGNFLELEALAWQRNAHW